MKVIHALAFFAAGAVLISSAPLCGSEVDGPIELSFNTAAAYQPHLSYDVIRIGDQARVPVKEQAALRLQDEVGVQWASPSRPEAEPMPDVYSPKIELRAARPNGVVPSKKHPGMEYSGILVQSVGNNPLQLLNPLAPARYGDGEENTVWSVITGRATGLKVLGIRF